jgi:hypothetical protein
MPNYYGFYPKSVLSLGAGFDPNDLSQGKLRCIEFEIAPDEVGALTTEFAELLVRNSTQLKSALNVDLKIDASYLIFSGEGSFAYTDSTLFEARSLTAVLSAITRYGRLTMKNPKLSSTAQNLIDTGKMRDFAERYGSAFVVQEDRGASVSMILMISDVSEDVINKINTSMAAKGGFGPFSASAKTIFQTESQRASREGRLNVQIVSTGGEGLGELSGIAEAAMATTDSFQKIQVAFGQYLKGFKSETAAPIGLHTQSMTAFGWNSGPEDQDIYI